MKSLAQREREALKDDIRKILQPGLYSLEKQVSKLIGLCELTYISGQVSQSQAAFQFPERELTSPYATIPQLIDLECPGPNSQ